MKLLETLQNLFALQDGLEQSVQPEIKAQLSNRISELIRQYYIYVSKTYLETGFNDYATINLNNNGVKFELEPNSNEEDYEKIYAYFWGPCHPLEYFKSDFRISVIDWEPYMCKGDFDNYSSGKKDRLGGNNQAEEYQTFSSLEAVTHTKAVNFCQQLIQTITSKDLSKDAVMRDHMCILEHNFFPALALNTTKSHKGDVKSWTLENKDLLAWLLTFYDSNIIIGTYDLLNELCTPYNGLFCVARGDAMNQENGESTQSLLDKYPEARIIGRRVIRSYYYQGFPKKEAMVLLDERGVLWIGAVHFASRNDFWSDENQVKMAQWIHEILLDIDKGEL